ncbi:LysR family transcriptional regulator [Bradyrhizobium sp. 2TAF24]|uniref:LysR family transcriptional regulator n=1 Tax=Bradyrhizobium sp. 2TAF24 TaxID=3233011 RepID=UPI003F92DA66
MDLSWLEDFLAIVDCGGFSRAAEKRNISQPAFSRRVRALEDWVGAALFDRSTHNVVLTAAGERFRPVAEETLRRLYLGREEAMEASRASAGTLRFAATNALSLTFFPAWLRGVEQRAALSEGVRLVADTMAACERIMLQGQAQFLLCHHHPAAQTLLDAHQFRSTHLGDDMLVPVCAPDPARPGQPRYPLPGEAARPLPHLAYSAESGMGRIVEAVRGVDGPPAFLHASFTSHVATVLVAMAREGRGVAWSPLSLVADDFAAGRLVRAGDAAWDIPIEIRLFRARARQSAAAERFWALLDPVDG